jgi:hypothetical protein
MRHISFTLLTAATIAAGATALAQTRVRTESIRPPANAAAAPNYVESPSVTGTAPIRLPPAAPDAAALEIITDVARLPAPVARTRERILSAARSGELANLLALMESSDPMPIFSLGDEKNPISYWKSSFPDSDGLEILATLTDILETGFLHVDEGTPQELYLWPYFARTPLKTLTPAQKVDLFKIVTGSDYRGMLDGGTYNFYRIGIGKDGTWRFFVAGD